MMLITSNPIQARYSRVGGELAKQAMTSYDRANQWTDADRFIGSGLQSIAANPESTSDEKALASMGSAMGAKSGMSWENSAKARYAVASVIASAAGGPIGAVLAKATVNAYGPADKWTDADHIAGQGLKAIQKNPEATELDRELASLGLAMGSHAGMKWENSAKARFEVAKEIASSPNGPTGAVLASVTVRAVDVSNQWTDADKVAGDGLQAILSSSHSSQLQKSLAQAALDQTSRGGIQWENSARVRTAALQQIQRA